MEELEREQREGREEGKQGQAKEGDGFNYDQIIEGINLHSLLGGGGAAPQEVGGLADHRIKHIFKHLPCSHPSPAAGAAA